MGFGVQVSYYYCLLACVKAKDPHRQRSIVYLSVYLSREGGVGVEGAETGQM